jgi:hypothetical protein
VTLPANECGHVAHETVLVPIDLGQSPFHDFASFPENRRQRFDFEVFNYPRYRRTDKIFCQGQDGFAAGVLEQGIWEAFETRLAVEIFAREKPGVVFDFGCHAGWFSVLAAKAGHEVIAWDAEADSSALCERNLDRTGRRDWIVHNRRVDGHGRQEPEPVVLLKADVEGMEFQVVEECRELFVARAVQYVMLEVSPCFKPGYDELLAWIMAQGYDLFLVPDKGCKYLAEYSADPLAVIERTQVTDPVALVAGVRQVNVLLVRR